MVLALVSRAHAVAPASRATRAATSLGRTPRPASARRSMRRGTAIRPSSLVPRASHPWAAVLPYPHRAAQPTARRRTRRTSPPALRAIHRPCRGLCHDWVTLTCKETSLTALRRAIKAATSFSTRVSTQPAVVRHRCRSGELHLRLLFSQTRVAPHSTRTPVAPALACWPARAAGSPGPVSLRPPPGSHRRALLPARSPS
jgi:hypothetical protein